MTRPRSVALGIVLVAGALFTLCAPRSALSQSQQGGLPDVSRRVTVLEGIATTLQTTVTSLQSQNTSLQSALNAEIAARTAAEAALRAAVDAEAAARGQAIEGLQGLLNLGLTAEQLNRQNLDGALRQLINSRPRVFEKFVGSAILPNGVKTTVASLGSLPAGTYLFLAKANVHNSEHEAFWNCNLRLDDDAGFDQIFVETDASDVIPGVINRAALSMMETRTLAAPGVVTMTCESRRTDSTVENISLIGVQVGEVTAAP